MKFYYIYISVIWIIIAIKWGTYENLKKYYPTIIFIIMGDFIYNLLVKDNLLWRYESQIFTHIFIDIMWAFTVFPSFILLYLSYYPTKLKKQVIYIAMWAGLFTLLEYITHLLGHISYDYGWNIFYSFISWILMFKLIKIHTKHFFIANILYLIIAYGSLVLFDLPLRILK